MPWPYSRTAGLSRQGSAGVINTGFDFAVARYNSDGALDSSFGKVTTDFGPVTPDIVGTTDQPFAVAVQSDGKIVAAGQADSISAAPSHWRATRREALRQSGPSLST
jgi:hypothetical protein